MSVHVPEQARDTTGGVWRSSAREGCNGAFDVNSPQPGWRLAFVVSDGGGWEHVSVSAYREKGIGGGRQTRVPSWGEMCAVKSLCWDDEDVVVQIHPKRSEYVNEHPHVLHLWRPVKGEMPMPAAGMVGRRDPGEPVPPERENAARAWAVLNRVVGRER